MIGRHRTIALVALAMAVVAGALALAGLASAATIPAESARQFYSVQSTGDRVFWFQRIPQKLPKPRRRRNIPPTVITVPDSGAGTGTGTGTPITLPPPDYYYFGDPNQPGAILSRQLSSSDVQAVFKPQPGKRIVAFKIRAGRILIGLSAVSDPQLHTTEIVELKQDGAAWTATPVFSRPGAPADGNCGSTAGLLNVNERGEVIIDDRTFEGGAGGCKILRVKSDLIAIAPDGTQRTIQSRVSGWANDPQTITFDALKAGPGDWYFTSKRSEWDSNTIGVENIETNEQTDYPQIDRDFYSTEINGAGASLTMNPYTTKDRTLLFPDPQHLDNTIHLGRRSAITWFHLCEDKIIEIARRRATKKHRGGKSWEVWIRDTSGNVQRRLGVRIARGTIFESCNADYAFFHRYLRRGRARQFSIQLNAIAPSPTGATAGATGPTS